MYLGVSQDSVDIYVTQTMLLVTTSAETATQVVAASKENLILPSLPDHASPAKCIASRVASQHMLLSW